jgi:uncharacterized membrane protein YbhN (UPF0104 family)
LPLVQGVISVGLLIYIFRDPALREAMGRTLGRASWRWLLAGVGLGAVWIPAAVRRWQLFLRLQGVEFPLKRAMAVYLIGMFFTLFMPGFIATDGVRVAYLFRERPGRKAKILLSVMMDHLSGLLAMMLTAAAIGLGRAEWFAQSRLSAATMYGLLGFLVAAVTGLAIGWLMTQTRMMHWMPRRMPWRQQLLNAAHAFGLFFQRWRLSLRGTGYAFVTLYGYFLTFYCTARAFGAQATLLDVISIMPVVDAISALPISMAGLGVREKLLQELLGQLAGVPAEVALLVSLAGFGCSAVWALLGGVLFPFYRARPTPDEQEQVPAEQPLTMQG